jgi:[CysO sulfur-carrier protein]-S-L-cysteine hydrolase
MDAPLVVLRALAHELIQHAHAARPLECCGVLAGRAGVVSHRFELVNELASPTAFRASPRSMFDALRACRAAAVEIVAIDHSHPTTAAVPSARDIAEWHEPAWLVVIVGGDDEIRAWRHATPRPIEVRIEWREA